jgi:hypothetical protein
MRHLAAFQHRAAFLEIVAQARQLRPRRQTDRIAEVERREGAVFGVRAQPVACQQHECQQHAENQQQPGKPHQR